MTQKILDVLSGQVVKPYPIWMMRQAGRHLPEYMKIRETAKDFIDFCFSPDKASEVTLQPVNRYDMDAAILFADILLVPIALGREVKFIKGTGPVLDPITARDISNLDNNLALLEPVYETVRLVRKQLDGHKTLIGFCGGPWTVATYMIEGKGSPKKEIAKRFAYENPEAMDLLLERIADASAHYLISQGQAGADVLKIFESWAENLSPELFERLVIRPTQRIISKVREAGITQPIIGFPRGGGLNAVRYAYAVKTEGLALGTDVPLADMRALVGDKLALQGNLDPLTLRIGGDALRQAVEKVLGSIKGPHIFNLGHGVTPDVKIDNVHAVIKHIRTGEADYV